jgi:hypothetical protein
MQEQPDPVCLVEADLDEMVSRPERSQLRAQPMSTPTAAGMMAPSVGSTEPTVAPLPRCASGIKAMCGKTKGMLLAANA